MEVYPPRGVLLYPSRSSYYTGQEIYREILLPGREICELFREAFFQLITEDLCDSPEETRAFLETLR